MYKKSKNTNFIRLLSAVALVCFLSYLPSFLEWVKYLIVLLKIWLKLKFIYVYYEIIIYWVLLALFSLILPLFRKCFFLFLFFSVFFFNFLKPKLFYKYLFKSWWKQHWRGILLNMYVFNLINFTKLCSLLATFFNSQQMFQHCLNVVVRVIWHCSVGQCQVKVETALCMSILKFTTPNNVESVLSISVLILTILDNLETMLLFSMPSFTALINVELMLRIWQYSKSWKEQKNIFEPQKKMTHFINNTWKENENNSMSLLMAK